MRAGLATYSGLGLRLALVAFVALGTVGVAVSPAAAALCRGTNGVSVVVDYGRAGGAVDKRCAPGDPTNGLTALSGAGLPYTFVPGQPGLVCTIKNVPDPCNGAPVRAYWSYWHLLPNHTWQYSSVGAGSYNPAPGATEGWAFGNSKPPRIPRPTNRDELVRPDAVTSPRPVIASGRRRRR